MTYDLKTILSNKALNGWNLFLLITVPMSVLIILTMLGTDMSTGEGVSSMIGFSVRFAIPFILLITAIGAFHALFPGSVSAWLKRNLKYIGLCFAVAMAWQGTFIFVMSNFFREYYYESVYLLRDELEGTVGYIFLTAMVVTSFHFGRKYVTPEQWKLLHRSAVYFLWAYPMSVYWFNTSSYKANPELIDYVFYWGLFLAFTLRIAAWGKQRTQAAKRNSPNDSTPLAMKVIGSVLISFGLVVSATHLYWREPVTAFLTAPEWSAELVLWLPFWPFEPFLSFFIIGLGTALFTKTRVNITQPLERSPVL